MAGIAAQIRGSYVLAFQVYEAVPAFADVLAAPPWTLADGDVIVIIDAGQTPPVITAQGLYSHPAPTVTAINGPVA